MKKQLLMFSFMVATISNAATFDTNTFFDATNQKSQWEKIEKSFITDVAEYTKSIWNAGSLITLSTLSASAFVSGVMNDNQSQFNFSTKRSYSFLASSLLASFVALSATGIV